MVLPRAREDLRGDGGAIGDGTWSEWQQRCSRGEETRRAKERTAPAAIARSTHGRRKGELREDRRRYVDGQEDKVRSSCRRIRVVREEGGGQEGEVRVKGRGSRRKNCFACCVTGQATAKGGLGCTLDFGEGIEALACLDRIERRSTACRSEETKTECEVRRRRVRVEKQQNGFVGERTERRRPEEE